MLLYRTSGAWGPGTGANLTAAQVDGNFYDVSTRVQFLELNAPTPVQIVSISAAGNQLYFHMSDGTVQGPVTMPVSKWFWRGSWQPNTPYSVNDTLAAPNGSIYLVMFAHTSASVFDPGANDGAGHDYYSLLFAVPSTTLPSGGGTGYVLTKASSANYDTTWSPPGVLPGGSTGQVLRKNTSVDGDASWFTLRIANLGDVSLTSIADGDFLRWSASRSRWVNRQATLVLTASSWAPVVGDEGAFMVLTNGSSNVVLTVPSDSSQAFQIGTELNIHQDGTGSVTVVGDSGVTILKHASFSNQLLGQYATASLKKTGANEWRLFGLLSGA